MGGWHREGEIGYQGRDKHQPCVWQGGGWAWVQLLEVVVLFTSSRSQQGKGFTLSPPCFCGWLLSGRGSSVHALRCPFQCPG